MEQTESREGKMARKKKSNGASEETTSFRERFTATVSQLSDSFVAREESISVIALALLTRNNFLLIGDPGTAKTRLVECFFEHVVDASHFSCLCGSFTMLDEIVGPTDIKKFQDGRWGRVTEDMLPEADFAFLDEIMKSNDGTMNMLLRILNEREFGGEKIPLWTVGAATNWPEVDQRSEKVEALYDRFVLRHHVQCCAGEDHTRMLVASAKLDRYSPAHRFTIDELRAAREEVRSVSISQELHKQVTGVVKRLKEQGTVVSDRRSAKSLDVLRARAWCSGRDAVTLLDFEALRYVFWGSRDEIKVIEAVTDTIDREVVKSAVANIDKVRQQYADLSRSDRDARVKAAGVLIKNMAETANETKALLKSGTLTEKGAEELRKANGKLKSDYLKFREDVGADLGLGKKVAP